MCYFEDAMLDYLKNKKILILGFAREGIDTLRFLRRLFPKKAIAVADKLEIRNLTLEIKNLVKNDKAIESHFGKDYLKKIGDYDIIIKSPGIPPKTIKPFLKKDQIVTSQTEIFFDNCPGKIIGITGTKGKSTTASLIYEVLKKGGIKAHLLGNIGKPVLSHLFKAKPDDIYVCELSSHQLLNLKKSPQIAVFLNIYPEHLDYYKDFKQYLKAKQNICRYQKSSDFFLFNPDNKDVKKTSAFTKAKKIALSPKKAKEWGRVNLLGGFNLLNMAAAAEVGRIFKIPDKTIAKALKSFKPLPHRLEFAGTYKKIRFYNDSLATIPEATMAALDALGKDVETIFLGGFDRGLDFKGLAKRILKSNLKNLVFFPATGKRIWKEIIKLNKKNRFFHCLFTDKMKTGVAFAYKQTLPGKICLLSCASPSFGLFKDYRERGDLFKKCVKEAGRK